MKLTDYWIIDRCAVCGAPIYVPTVWKSRKYDKPKYPTCQHVKRKEDTHNQAA